MTHQAFCLPAARRHCHSTFESTAVMLRSYAGNQENIWTVWRALLQCCIVAVYWFCLSFILLFVFLFEYWIQGEHLDTLIDKNNWLYCPIYFHVSLRILLKEWKLEYQCYSNLKTAAQQHAISHLPLSVLKVSLRTWR